MRSIHSVCFTITLAAVTACGSGGNGGIPSSSHLAEDSPPAETGSGTPAGKGAGILPGHDTPGSGSGFGAGDSTHDCAQACDLVAACGGTSKSCFADCSAASSSCVACVATATCATVQECVPFCAGSSSAGAGGSSHGTGGHGAGGSKDGAGGSPQGAGAGPGAGGSPPHGAGGSSASFTCDDLATCCNGATFPMQAKMGCQQLVMLGQDPSCSQALQAYKQAQVCP